MTNLRAGDDVIINAGVYRETIMVPQLDGSAAPTRIRAATPHTVTVKGSSEVGGWALSAGGVYSVAWLGDEPEQVFRNGTSLQQIGGTVFGGYPTNPPADLAGAHASEGGIWPGRVAGNASSLTADSFTYDSASRRLYIKVAVPLETNAVLEVSTRIYVLDAESINNLTISGLDFAHSNTSFMFRQGAIKVQGANNVVNDITVKDMDGQCLQLIGIDSALTNSSFDRCGQVGLTGRGTRLTISGNVISHGNTRGFNKWWEAGGIKLVGTGGLQDSSVVNNVVTYNDGDGIWIDFKNPRNLIEGNTSAYNSGFGIQYEASQSGTIRRNVVYGNGMRGIYLLESSGTLVDSNAVFGNAMEGIAIVDGTRSAADPSLKPVNNRVVNNTVAWNDLNRNWVQLVLPAVLGGCTSDQNTFKASNLFPRYSAGFAGASNPAYERLDSWRAWIKQDALSAEQMLPMPAALQGALAAKRILLTSELPSYLAQPGV